MTLKDCNAIMPDYRYLVGKKVIYNNETYRVKDIFPIPTEKAKLNLFINLHVGQRQSPSIALSSFMTDADLDIVLKCLKLSDESIEFLSPIDVKVID